MKKGYWISLYLKIDNQENLKKYAETVTPIIKGFGGKPLVRGGKYETFSGDNSRKKLEKFELDKLPIYIQNNLEKFKEWID